jgi:hypothetical protein
MQLTAIQGGLVDQEARLAAFMQEHPGTEMPPGRVWGMLLAWVPLGSDKSGVQFSGRTLRELLDDAEAFFREAEQDPG